MSNLKSPEELATHVKNHKGLPADRKKEIADHLGALHPDHHKAVFAVLQDHAPDAESRFIKGCFGEPPAPAPAPDLPPAA